MADKTGTTLLPSCIESRACYNTGRYGTAVFHPGHAHDCPRHVPNVGNYCTDCGVAVHYRSHMAWCIRTQAPNQPSPADRDVRTARFLRDEFCDCPGHGLADDQHSADGCRGLEVAGAFWRATRTGKEQQ